MNKSPAAILAESLAAGRVKQKLYPVVETETLVDNKSHNELSKADNKEYLNSEKDSSDFLNFAEVQSILPPTDFWKTWCQAHANALKKCSSNKDCSCFEGLGSVM